MHDEPRDPAWSAGAEQALDRSLRPVFDASGVELVELDCRSTVCRIGSTHQDLESVEAFMQQASAAVEWEHSGMVEIEEHGDGEVSVVMTISRDPDFLM